MQEIDDYYQALLLKNIEERAQKLISRNDNDETDLKSHPGITWKTVVSGLKSCSASYSSPGTAKQVCASHTSRVISGSASSGERKAANPTQRRDARWS